MKSIYINLFFLLIGQYGISQKDTLYVNDTHNLVLVFPEPIKRAVTGHPNFSFGFDPNWDMRLGLLQGHPGPDSNLLVLTSEGRAFTFYLEYREQLAESHMFVGVNESIGNISELNEKDKLRDVEKKSTHSLSRSDSIHFGKGSAFFLKDPRNNSLKSKRKGGIILRLRSLDYFGSETYLTMELENTSKIDLELDFVEVFKEQGNPGKRSSHQKTNLTPLFKYQMPNIVRVGQRQQFVYVLPKFTLGDKERLLIELREKKGNRRVVLLWD